MHPIRMTEDCIVEALIEIQFSSARLPELVIAKLIETLAIETLKREQEPFGFLPADAPEQVRDELDHMPHVKFMSEDGLLIYRIGRNTISVHNVTRYLGWTGVLPHFARAIDAAYSLGDATIDRMGLRYINIVDRERHKIGSVADLCLKLQIDGKVLDHEMSIGFRVPGDVAEAVVRLSTPDFVRPKLPEGAVAMIDIDVSSSSLPQGRAGVLGWLDAAHDMEKTQFFKLFPPEIIEKLTLV